MASSTYADKKKAEQELQELKKAIQAVQTELNNNRKLQSKAEKSLVIADKALARASKALNQTNQAIKTNRHKLKQLEIEQQQKRTDSRVQKKLLASQLRSAYVSGNEEYIKLLLNQEDPAKVTRILKYYDYLNKARINDIKSLQRTLLRLNQIGIEITDKISQLEQLSLKQKQQQKNKQALKQQQQIALASLKKEYSNNNQRLSKLKRNELELQKLLAQLEQTLKNFSPPQSLNGLAKFKKKLNWPIKGSVLHKFGSTKLGDSLRWNGIIISGREGKQVQAISQGRVVFSDWLRGFGLMTIIDHGQGYLSLYGHNQTLLKNAGDFVEAGEPVATIGQSGGFSQTGLYFEIRYKGKPQNPLSWIRN